MAIVQFYQNYKRGKGRFRFKNCALKGLIHQKRRGSLPWVIIQSIKLIFAISFTDPSLFLFCSQFRSFSSCNVQSASSTFDSTLLSMKNKTLAGSKSAGLVACVAATPMRPCSQPEKLHFAAPSTQSKVMCAVSKSKPPFWLEEAKEKENFFFSLCSESSERDHVSASELLASGQIDY